MGARVARIGSDRTSEVVLDDPTVAALHATLRLHGGVWMLESHAAGTGSSVDGESIDEPHVVAPGSIVRFGTVELVFDSQDVWADSVASPDTLAGAADAEGRAVPAPIFMIAPTRAGAGWLPWALVGTVVLLAIAAVLLAGGSR